MGNALARGAMIEFQSFSSRSVLGSVNGWRDPHTATLWSISSLCRHCRYCCRKHTLNCHRMRPALFQVLCEIKEKTGNHWYLYLFIAFSYDYFPVDLVFTEVYSSLGIISISRYRDIDRRPRQATISLLLYDIAIRYHDMSSYDNRYGFFATI